MSIKTKIGISQIALIFMAAIFIYEYYPAKEKKVELKLFESKVKNIANLLSFSFDHSQKDNDKGLMSDAINWVASDKMITAISVRDYANNEIASYGESNVFPSDLTGNEFKVGEKQEILFYSEEQGANKSQITIAVGYSLKGLNQDLRNLQVNTLYFSILLIVVGIFFAMIVGKLISNNISILHKSVNAISKGNEKLRIDIKSKDEIGKLGLAFNNMLNRLEESRNKLVTYSQQLTKQNEELDQYSYVVSHDLKAPLNAIFKLSEWIEEDSYNVLPEESKQNFEMLKNRAQRMQSLINGLLEYSKIGRINIPTERINLNLLINDVIETLNPGDKFIFNIQKDMPVIKGKKLAMQEVFFNLILNAVKYNDKENGIITVSHKELEEYHQITIADNGMGINPAYHEKIFGVFQTLEARDKVEGTGIGLSIVRKFIQDFGGKIWVESEEGKGASFIFTIPKENL